MQLVLGARTIFECSSHSMYTTKCTRLGTNAALTVLHCDAHRCTNKATLPQWCYSSFIIERTDLSASSCRVHRGQGSWCHV